MIQICPGDFGATNFVEIQYAVNRMGEKTSRANANCPKKARPVKLYQNKNCPSLANILFIKPELGIKITKKISISNIFWSFSNFLSDRPRATGKPKTFPVELQIVSRSGDEILLGNGIPPAYHKYRLAGSTPITTISDFGDMLFQHFAGAGFDIWYSVYGIRSPVTLIARADVAVLELHIPFKNQMTAKWDGIVHEEMAEKQFDLSFTPFVYNQADFGRIGEYHTFDVHYHKETLHPFAPYFPLLAKFLEKVEKGIPASLLGSTRFLSPEMIRVVNEMLQYDFLESLAPAFYESKAMELLILMLRNISGIQPSGEKFPHVSLEYAQAARELILSDLEHQYTASELARKTGTNVYTLKTTFRSLFGCSLFRFGEHARMDMARQLLLEGKNTVSEIAWLAGYPDVQNFSTAFKRHFHQRPTEIHRKN